MTAVNLTRLAVTATLPTTGLYGQQSAQPAFRRLWTLGRSASGFHTAALKAIPTRPSIAWLCHNDVKELPHPEKLYKITPAVRCYSRRPHRSECPMARGGRSRHQTPERKLWPKKL